MPNGMNNYELLQAINKSGGGGGESQHTYSTDEKAVGKWIDGKTVYEKSYEFVMHGINYNTPTSTEISIPNIDTLVNLDGGLSSIEAGWGELPANEYRGEAYINFYIDSNDMLQVFQLFTNSHASQIVATLVATVRYTKTTD